MELIAGETLAKRPEKGALPTPDAPRIGAEIAAVTVTLEQNLDSPVTLIADWTRKVSNR